MVIGLALHAEYHKNDIYLAHRVLQAYSTAEFVKLTKYPADLSVVVGDLNTGPGDISYRIITEIPSLLDPFDVECIGTDASVTKASGTSDNANNSYTDTKQAKNDPEGKRIDHILYFAKPNLQYLDTFFVSFYGDSKYYSYTNIENISHKDLEGTPLNEDNEDDDLLPESFPDPFLN
ncbi:Putative neutral sphingomyelinase [Eumeta japonica]|uniref:Neutral sphingomyelinase n=1 Tax=Eumeta variegata TaxID=151549 RepID=A0A4C1XW16_EUMVA|nr:Putative neutral sphingomyelinase [Eumeta japonica]